MRTNTSTQWILALLLFFTSNFVTQAQTLDATFSSPLTNQCAGSLFTLNATTTTYQGYSWTIDGPNNFSNTSTGTTSALYLTEPGTYNVSLSVTDGVTTETNTVSGFLNVATPAIANAGVDQTICANSTVTLNGTAGGSASSMSWSGGTGTFSTNSSQVTTYSPSPSEIANGFVNLILTTNDPAGPCAADRDTVMILFNSLPTVSAPTSLCVGSTAQLSPSSGGIWTSSNDTRATISAISGLATGISPGNVTFTFTSNATSCSNSSSNVTVNSLPTVTLSANTVCVNGTVQLTPNSGGTWITNNSSVASVTYPILVTGLAQGTASFTFTNSTTGCSKTTQNLNVGVGTNPVLSVPSAFCEGTSVQLLPSSGGTWTSNMVAVASVTNNGIAVGTISGFVTFTYVNTVTGCSATSSQVQVYGLQQVSVPTSVLCVNSTMQLSPNSGGTWVSSDPSVASITNAGLVTGLASGTVNFTFTNSTTGCIRTTNNLTVSPLPTFTLSKTDPTTCNGTNGTINILGLTPNTSYQYSYVLPNVSNGPITTTSNSSGQITIFGLSAGTYTLSILHPASGCQSTTQDITLVNPNAPNINDIQDQVLCGTTYSLPVITGTNLPGNQAYYTGLNGTGSVISTGTVISTTSTIYMYTSTIGGCIDEESFTVTIHSQSTVSAPASLCVGSTAQLSPSSGGAWTSNNSSRATINNFGIITGIAAGNVTFSYADNTTGCIGTTTVVTIVDQFVSMTSSTVCVNGTVQLTPNSGGTWVSNNPSIASVTNAGLVTGLAQGTATFTFTNSTTGCSKTTQNLNVGVGTNPVLSVPTAFCDQTSVQLLPSSGGTWTSNTAGGAATVTNNGLATGSVSGFVTFTYINTVTGCSATSSQVEIYGLQQVSMPTSVLCVNSTLQLSPNSGGTWVSSDPSVASITNAGLVTGLASGTVNFTFTNSTTGCIRTTNNLTVNPLPIVTLSSNTVCVNSTVQLTPSTSGTWISNNSSIATVSGINGLVTGASPGIVSFIFTHAATGCYTTSSNLTVTANATVDPIPDQIVCAGDSITAIAFSGSAQQFNWTNDNTLIGIAASGTGNISGFIATNPVFESISTITVTPESNGCGATSTSFTITVKFTPTVFPVVDQILCQDQGTQTINFSGTNPNTTYEWVHNNEAIGLLSAGTGFIPSFQAQNTSSFPLVSMFIVTPSLNGCLGTAINFAISVNPSSTVDPIPDQIACAGELISSITFSGSHPNTTYNWVQDNTSIGAASFGVGNIPSFQAQNPSSGSQIAMFIVTPFLEGCTGISDTFLISVNPLPLINAGNDTVLCSGESFTPIASGTFSLIVWNNGVFDGTPFTPTVTETYIATGVDLNSCSNSDSITVTINSVPQLTISTFDGEDSLACDGMLSVLVTDGTAPYSYTWTNGASNYTTSVIQNLCSGTYSLAVIDANGCSATNSATINDTLIENLLGDTLIFTDNIYQDSTIIGADTSAWIENCTFDYSLVTGATIDSYIDSGDSTIVTWIVALSNGSTVSVDATYFMSPGTTGVYDLTLQLYCSAKSGPKFLVASSRLYYEASSIGIQSLSLNSVFLYPNPTNSTLSISGINSDFSYKISDLQGKLLKQGANDKQIEIENLPAGTYVIGISTDNEVKQLRFVKL